MKRPTCSCRKKKNQLRETCSTYIYIYIARFSSGELLGEKFEVEVAFATIRTRGPRAVGGEALVLCKWRDFFLLFSEFIGDLARIPAGQDLVKFMSAIKHPGHIDDPVNNPFPNRLIKNARTSTEHILQACGPWNVPIADIGVEIRKSPTAPGNSVPSIKSAIKSGELGHIPEFDGPVVLQNRVRVSLRQIE